MNKKSNSTIAKFTVRALAISASTLAIFDFLKGEYQAGCILALGWLAIVIGEKRIFNSEEINSNG